MMMYSNTLQLVLFGGGHSAASSTGTVAPHLAAGAGGVGVTHAGGLHQAAACAAGGEGRLRPCTVAVVVLLMGVVVEMYIYVKCL